MGSGYNVGIFAEIAICFSGICRRSRSAVRQPIDFSPAMDGQKTILQNGALPSATHPLRKITKPLSSPLEGSEDFFGEADAEKATLFQRLLSPHPHPSKIVVIVAGMIGKFRKMACHFAPDAPCPGTS